MIPARVIERKREGGALTAEDVRLFFEGYLREEVTDYQMSAFLMAVLFRGFTPEELHALVGVMLDSGGALDLSDLPQSIRWTSTRQGAWATRCRSSSRRWRRNWDCAFR